MVPTVSARLSRPCSGLLALCGYMYTSYLLLSSTIVLSSFFIEAFAMMNPTPACLPPTPLYTLAQFNELHLKDHQKAEISHYLFTSCRLVVQKLIDN